MLKKIKHFRIDHLWVLVVLAGIFIFANTQPIRPHDFWWHMAVGREIMHNGKIPALDVYSFTAYGQPYPSYNAYWLAEVLLYSLYQLGGPALVVFFYSLFITSTYGLLLWLGWMVSRNWRAATLGVLIAAALGFNDWNVRPQGLAFMLGALILVSIYQLRSNHKWKWIFFLIAAMAVWVNSHGSFVLGLAFLAAWLADEVLRVLLPPTYWISYRNRLQQSIGLRFSAVSMVAGILSCFLNPRGVGAFSYLGGMAINPVIQNMVPEWAPPTFDSVLGKLFFAALLGMAALLAMSPRRPSLYQLFIFLGIAALGLKTSRGIVWFGIILAPIFADHITALLCQLPSKKPAVQRQGLTYSFAGVILLLAVITLPWFKAYLPLPPIKAGLISMETPTLATETLIESRWPGHIFNDMPFGSYLVWAAQPQYKVFVDTRIELFPIKVLRDYVAISNGLPDWEALLDDYGVNLLMLSPHEQATLITHVLNSPDWNLVYQDESAVIFIRRMNFK